MDYLKANYDRLLALVCALALIGAALYAVLGLPGVREEFTVPAARQTGDGFEENLLVSALQGELEKFTDPSAVAWGEAEGSLFVSRIYLLRDGELVDILESDTELYPGIPNEWIIQHRLDYTDADLADRDPDGDGFTNIEEFRAGTDPRDPVSRPPLWTKLRVKSFEKIPFRIKFMGAPSIGPGEPFNPDTQFSINTIDYSSPTQFLKIGDKIAGTELEIIKAEAKSATNAVGATVDVSELTVRDGTTGDEIVLVNEKEVDSPYSYAILAFPITGEDIRVEKGRTFSLTTDGETYKLIDVDSDGAVISGVDAGAERLKVPPL